MRFDSSERTRLVSPRERVFGSEPEPWIQRCPALGGSALWRSEEPDDWFPVIADPEGNELCICRSG